MKIVKKISAAAVCAAALFVTGCASTAESRSTGQVIDDTVTHTKVKAALVNDPVVSGTKIDVDVERGVVALSGAVNGEVARRKAEDIARGVDGVRGVQNNLIVREIPETTTDPDPSIEAEVNVNTR